jgi:ADP-heptose:LPS heptosyltransferase
MQFNFSGAGGNDFMNIKTIKFLDETVGPLICFCFHWYNSVKKIFLISKYKIVPEKVKNILIIKFFGMGSIILAGPMFRALRGKFPKAKIILLTFSSNKEISQRLGFINEVVGVNTGSFLKFTKSLLKSIWHIKKKRCEISIDLEFFSKSSTLIQYMCGTKIRIGYYLIQIGFLLKMMWRGNLLTHNVYYNPHKHTSEAFLALARSIGADTDDMSLPAVSIYDEDRSRLTKLLSNIEINKKNFIIIMNINASQLCLERRWPIEKFIELTKRILTHSNVKVILIGDTQDISYVDTFLKAMENNNKNLFNLTGQLDIGGLTALLEKGKIFITNDSGPLHIAASLGIPTVSFFGPEIPERYGPAGEKHTVFYSGAYCSPCLNVYNQKTAPCNGQNKCMRKISVEDVYKVITERYLK